MKRYPWPPTPRGDDMSSAAKNALWLFVLGGLWVAFIILLAKYYI
jgi:hypothetical protein